MISNNNKRARTNDDYWLSHTRITFNNDVASKFDTTILTPRRLLRIFRLQIKQYLEERKDVCSYLFIKYNLNLMEFVV